MTVFDEVFVPVPAIGADVDVAFGLLTQLNPPLVLLENDSQPSAINTVAVPLTTDDEGVARVLVVRKGQKLILLARVGLVNPPAPGALDLAGNAITFNTAPTLWTAGTTGSVVGRYVKVGLLVVGFLDVVGGTYTGNTIWSLPVAPMMGYWAAPAAHGHMWKGSARYPLHFASISGSGQDLGVYFPGSGGGASTRLGSGNAGALAATDVIRMQFAYLAAS